MTLVCLVKLLKSPKDNKMEIANPRHNHGAPLNCNTPLEQKHNNLYTSKTFVGWT